MPIGGHHTSASAMNHEQVVELQAQLKEMFTHLVAWRRNSIGTDYRAL